MLLDGDIGWIVRGDGTTDHNPRNRSNSVAQQLTSRRLDRLVTADTEHLPQSTHHQPDTESTRAHPTGKCHSMPHRRRPGFVAQEPVAKLCCDNQRCTTADDELDLPLVAPQYKKRSTKHSKCNC